MIPTTSIRVDTTQFETRGLFKDNLRDAISSVEGIIDCARNDWMYILVDHEDREKKGDLVILAQMNTPDEISFMAKNGRGLICLAQLKDRIGAGIEIAVDGHS